MRIPGLGPVVRDDVYGEYLSEPIAVPVLGGTLCSFIVKEYDGDDRPEDFHDAIRAFLTIDSSALTAAAPSIYEYYLDAMWDVAEQGWDRDVRIDGPDDVFDHVQFGNEPIVSRDDYRDHRVYVSLECECDWEPEHGLQIVFRDGRTVCKIGPYDGHLTNSAATGDDTLDGVVYSR